MTIQVDTREKARAIKKVLAEFDRQGVIHISSMPSENLRNIICRQYRYLAHMPLDKYL